MADRILLMTNKLELFTSLNEVANQAGWFVNNTVQANIAIRMAAEQRIKAIVWDLDSLDFKASLEALKQLRPRIKGPIIVLYSEINSSMADQLSELFIDDLVANKINLADVMRIIKQRVWVYDQITTNFDEDNDVSSQSKDISHLVKFHDLIVDTHHYSVSRNGEDLGLTPKEFKLFQYLVNHPNQVLSRDQLLEGVWGYDIMGTSRMVDIHISHIRDKIETDPQNPKWIKTARGFGYIFTDNAT